MKPSPNIKKIARPDRSPERARIQIIDGGNLLVFVSRRNLYATAIASFNRFADGDAHGISKR